MQRWEGFVELIDWQERTFTARLYDLEQGDTGDFKIGELYLDDVDEDDHELMMVGAVFNWIIGYRHEKPRRRERVSAIVFRRLPEWTAQDIEIAEKSADELAHALRWK